MPLAAVPLLVFVCSFFVLVRSAAAHIALDREGWPRLTIEAELEPDVELSRSHVWRVAMACQQADIPFAVVLGVANDVGPSAHAQWLSHREAAQEVARRAVRPQLG